MTHKSCQRARKALVHFFRIEILLTVSELNGEIEKKKNLHQRYFPSDFRNIFFKENLSKIE